MPRSKRVNPTHGKDASPSRLSVRGQRIVDAYLRAGHGMTKADAYGLEHKNKDNSYRFWQRPSVKKYLEQQRELARQETRLSLHRTLKEVAAVAYSNIKDIAIEDYLDEEGVLDLQAIPDHVAAAIHSIRIISQSTDKAGNKRAITQIKFHDKTKALDMIMRHLGAYELDNAQQNITDPLTDILQSVTKRGMPKPISQNEGLIPHDDASVVSEQYSD